MSATASSSARSTRFTSAAVFVAPAAVMIGVGSWGLDRGSMWDDEEATLSAAGRSWSQLILLTQQVDLVHLAFYALMHLWLVLLPSGMSPEVWLRLPSVFAVGVSAGLVALIASRLAGPGAGLLSGLIGSVLPFVSSWAQEARSPALVGAFVLLATLCLVAVLQRERAGGRGRAWWTGYGASMFLAVGLHEFAVLAVAAHATSLALLRVPRPVWRRWLLASLPTFALGAALAWATHEQSAQVSWISTPDLSSVKWLLGKLFGNAVPAAAALFVLSAVGAFGHPKAGDAKVGDSPWAMRPGLLALPLLVVPGTLLLSVSQLVPLYVDRYVFYSVWATALLSGLGLRRVIAFFGPNWLQIAASAAVLSALFVACLPNLQSVRTPDWRPDNLAAAAEIVGDGARAGDGALFVPASVRATAIAYPQSFSKVQDLALDRSPEESGTLYGLDRPTDQTRQRMMKAPRVWVLTSDQTVLQTERFESANEMALSTFRKVSQTRVKGLIVTLYVRR